MIYGIIFILLSALAYWYWSRTFTPKEVKLNDADITANTNQDNLRKGYHSRRNWVRGLTLGALSATAALPAWWARSSGWQPSLASWPVYLLCLLAVAMLLGGYFIRYFTPLLNLARRAAGRLDIGEYYCSTDSASWPDAAVVKPLRKQFPAATNEELQPMAARNLESLLTRTWLLCRLAAAILAAAAIGVATYN